MLIRLRRTRAITLNKFQIIIMGNRDSLSSLILSWFRRVEKEKSKQSNKLSRFYYMYTKYVLSQNIKPNFFPTLKSSHWSWGDLKGPHDPTRATSMKTSLKNRLFYDSVSHVALFLKRREFLLELKRGDAP